MSTILLKIFAVALALSQITTRPDVKTAFDPVRDQAEAMQLLRDGCSHMLKVFDLENINIDELITIAMNDPQAVTSESKVFKGINFDDLAVAYREISKSGSAATSAINARFPWLDMGEVLAFYNKAVTDLPDVTKLKDQKLRGLTSCSTTRATATPTTTSPAGAASRCRSPRSPSTSSRLSSRSKTNGSTATRESMSMG